LAFGKVGEKKKGKDWTMSINNQTYPYLTDAMKAENN
jgi:hypothetical protein